MALAVVGVAAWGLAESITATNDLVRLALAGRPLHASPQQAPQPRAPPEHPWPEAPALPGTCAASACARPHYGCTAQSFLVPPSPSANQISDFWLLVDGVNQLVRLARLDCRPASRSHGCFAARGHLWASVCGGWRRAAAHARALGAAAEPLLCTAGAAVLGPPPPAHPLSPPLLLCQAVDLTVSLQQLGTSLGSAASTLTDVQVGWMQLVGCVHGLAAGGRRAPGQGARAHVLLPAQSAAVASSRGLHRGSGMPATQGALKTVVDTVQRVPIVGPIIGGSRAEGLAAWRCWGAPMGGLPHGRPMSRGAECWPLARCGRFPHSSRCLPARPRFLRADSLLLPSLPQEGRCPWTP